MNPQLSPSFFRAVVLAVVLCARGSAFAAAEADVFIGYDVSYANGNGGADNVEVIAANVVAGSNAINERSGAPGRMRIVGFKQSNEANFQRTSNGGFVGWMNSYDSRIADVVVAADGVAADLVAYVCDSTNDGAAAVAYQPGRYSSFDGSAFWANVFAHETGGHNYGCDHSAGRTGPTTIMMHNYCGGGSQGYFSNPNIWLNGVQLYGGMNLGTCAFVGGGDNAYHISTSAQGRADDRPRITYGSNLYPIVHRWQFNTAAGAAPAGMTIASSVGGAVATVRGQGATFTGNGLRLPGGTTGDTAADSIAAYLDLPNGTFSSMANWTIEVWATPRAGSAWARVLEIGRTVQAGDGLGAAGEWTGTPGSPAPGATTASDVIGLTAARDTGSLATQRLIVGVDGTHLIKDTGLATAAGEMRHYAITFTDTSAGATIKWFRDGALIAKQNVTFKSADLEDVNAWLGRSLWSGDTQAQIDYHDVRIIGAALADGQIAGNYRIGPHDAKSTMWADDAYNASAFTSGAWEFGGTVVGTRDYEVGAMLLRSPRNASNVAFPGKSLGITGGMLNLDATGSRTVTVNDLRLNGGATIGAYTSAGTQTLAGTINAKNFTENTIRGDTNLVLAATITGGVGGGGLHYIYEGTTITGNNTGFLGATVIGDGRFSRVKISSETNLGGNPTFYGGGWLQLNRGILETTATMTIDDPNRGVMIGPSGGIFRPAAGTTLTIASTLNSPAAGNTLQTAPMFPNPVVGYLFKESAGTLVLTNPNNSYIGEMHVTQGELRLDGAGRLNNGDHHMPLKIGSTLHVNTTGDQIFGGVVSGGGTFIKANTGTTTFYGANTFSGSVTINGGTVFARATNAATNRNFSYVSGITVNSGATLKSQANSLFGWDGTQAKPITVNAGGTLTTDAANADVNVGTITLNGGTLAGFTSTAWGSWSFKRVNGGKIVATENSTVSAPNVSIGSNNTVEVAAGKTLTWSGAITDLSSEGICALVKGGGAGTLILTGANIYTGATALNTGTTFVNGSLGAGSAVTVAGSATLAGTGAVNGALTFAANAVHAPGGTNGLGTQTVGGALGYGAAARVKFNLASNSNAIGTFSRVAGSGALSVAAGALIDLTFNSAGSSTNFYDTFWTQARSWPVVSSNGTTGTFALGTVTNDSTGKAASAYGTFALTHGATGATLQWTPSPFASWRGTKFGPNAGNAAISDFLADPDGDGNANALEYFHDKNPAAGDASAIQAQTFDGRLAVVFPRNIAATDLVATVRGADSPAGPWTDLARSAGGAPFAALVDGVTVNETGSGAGRTVEVRDLYLTTDPAHPKRFLRLAIEPQ